MTVMKNLLAALLLASIGVHANANLNADWRLVGEDDFFGSSDFPMGNLSRIQIKPAAVEIDGDLEMVTVPESTGTFLYSCNL